MWSQTNKEYVEELVNSNHQEYPYYVAHTCTYWGNGTTYGRPTIKIYFSKEPIVQKDLYTYTLSGDCLFYSINANNANQNSNEARMSVVNYTARTVKIDDYEFVYTNAECQTGVIQPDITANLNVSQSHFDGVSLILLAILLGCVVAKIIKG